VAGGGGFDGAAADLEDEARGARCRSSLSRLRTAAMDWAGAAGAWPGGVAVGAGALGAGRGRQAGPAWSRCGGPWSVDDLAHPLDGVELLLLLRVELLMPRQPLLQNVLVLVSFSTTLKAVDLGLDEAAVVQQGVLVLALGPADKFSDAVITHERRQTIFRRERC